MSSKQIHRITLFNVPDSENQKKLIEKYTTMKEDALKDGKPYILSVVAGTPQEDQRAKGFTVAAISVFAGIDDMTFYDKECQAHASLRKFAGSVHQGFCMAYFESVV